MKLFLKHKCFKVSLICDILTLVCFDGGKAEMNNFGKYLQFLKYCQTDYSYQYHLYSGECH